MYPILSRKAPSTARKIWTGGADDPRSHRAGSWRRKVKFKCYTCKRSVEFKDGGYCKKCRAVIAQAKNEKS